jgi:Na+(H+)/acetate symporter ActP
VFWSLFFIFLLYFTAPCLAVLAKYDMFSNLVGSSFASLPPGRRHGQGGPWTAEHHRHQQGRHRAVGRSGDRRRL